MECARRRRYLAHNAGGFCATPTIVAGFMAREADTALLESNPAVWMPIKTPGLFVTSPRDLEGAGTAFAAQ
jgi:hypothetical protein